MKYFIISLIVFSLFSCSKKEQIEDLDPYYSFYNATPIHWESVLGDTLYQYAWFDKLYSAFYVPNVFTPNGNGYNDNLIACGFNLRSYSVIIEDSKGKNVFTSQDSCDKTLCLLDVAIFDEKKVEYEGLKRHYPGLSTAIKIPPSLINWDGRYKGKPCAEGFYKVHISVVSWDGISDVHDMKVYLLRDFIKLPKDISNITLSEELDPEHGKIFESYEKQLMRKQSQSKE